MHTEQSTATVLAKDVKPVRSSPTIINNFFILLAFVTGFASLSFSSYYHELILYLPLLLILYDNGENQSFILGRIRNLIIPFVLVCIVQFVRELGNIKTPISKPKMDLLFFLLNDKRVRTIREIIMFLICLPSYYASFCICCGFFYLNDIFIVIFGLLCFIGVFGETTILKVFAGIALVSSIVQYVYIKIKERESLQYI